MARGAEQEAAGWGVYHVQFIVYYIYIYIVWHGGLNNKQPGGVYIIYDVLYIIQYNV